MGVEIDVKWKQNNRTLFRSNLDQNYIIILKESLPFYFTESSEELYFTLFSQIIFVRNVNFLTAL